MEGWLAGKVDWLLVVVTVNWGTARERSKTCWITAAHGPNPVSLSGVREASGGDPSQNRLSSHTKLVTEQQPSNGQRLLGGLARASLLHFSPV